ncbi:hypothetical protein HpSP79_02520 [Helicobacter pylori]
MKIQNFHIFLSNYLDIAHIISAFNAFFAIKFEAIDFEDEDAVGFILFHELNGQFKTFLIVSIKIDFPLTSKEILHKLKSISNAINCDILVETNHSDDWILLKPKTDDKIVSVEYADDEIIITNYICSTRVDIFDENFDTSCIGYIE